MSHATALITGATGGLGTAYADYLARHDHDLVLVARREAELERLAGALQRRYGRRVAVRPTDLSDASARAELLDGLERDGVHVTTLINNAGFGNLEPVADTDPALLTSMVEVNCAALVALSRGVLPGMLQRGFGAIVNVASTAAFQPLPDLATYAATKAFVLSFSRGLAEEVRDGGVRVLAVCPGPTETPFWANAKAADAMPMRRSAEQVVETTARALRDGRTVVTDGPLNVAQRLGAKLLPAPLVAPIAGKVLSR